MINPAALYLGAINTGFSLLSLVFLFPIAAVIYLDIQLVNRSILKEGKARVWALILSFVISLGGLGWGLWSVFTEFSLTLLFVAAGGAILLIFSLRALTTDKDDLENER